MFFPAEEFQERIARVRRKMAEQRADLLLLFGQEPICWTSGFYTPAHFACTVFAIPLEKEPFLVLRGLELPAALATSWVTDLLPYRDDADPIKALGDALRVRALDRGSIALDMHSWYLTAERYEALRGELPSAKLMPDQKMIDRLRIRKSPTELEYLRQAARIVEAGMKGAIAATRVGVSEREVAAAMADARIRAGSDLPIDGVLTTGERTLQSHGPWTDRKLQTGDLLKYEFHGIKNCYWARMLRPGVLGEPTADQKRNADILISAQNEALSKMRAGISSREIDRICREPVIAAGFAKREDFTNRVGYGLGLNFRPSPGEFLYEFTPQLEFTLEEGMVFHMILSAVGRGISDTIVVTAAGIKFITQFPRELFICPA